MGRSSGTCSSNKKNFLIIILACGATFKDELIGIDYLLSLLLFCSLNYSPAIGSFWQNLGMGYMRL